MFWGKGRHYPVPTHLRGVLAPDVARGDAAAVQGAVTCSCGGASFVPLYVGERVVNELGDTHMAPWFLRVIEIGGGFFLRLGARCVACQREHLLFDEHFHGWNGYVCGSTEDRSRARPPFHEWACHLCDGREHAIELTISGEDKQTALQEAEGALSGANWFDGFGWIDMSVTCRACGVGPSRIVSYETM